MKKIKEFLKEAREELGKVSWPTRDEVTRYTFVVIVMLLVMSVFLTLVDSVLGQIVKLVMK